MYQANDSDVVSLEESTPSDPTSDQGISPGTGSLATMLNWIRRLVIKDDAISSAVGKKVNPIVLSQSKIVDGGPEVFHPIPSTNLDGDFDSTVLMKGVRAYHDLHKSNLYGSGLIVGLNSNIPAPAFSTVADLPGYKGKIDSFSLLVSDYKNDDNAKQVITKAFGKYDDYDNSEFRLPDELAALIPRQLAWLVNATFVRAVLEMESYSLGIPEFVVTNESSGSGVRTARIVFHPQLGADRKPVFFEFKGQENPTSLRRAVKVYLKSMFEGFLTSAASHVATEISKAIPSFVKPVSNPDDDLDFSNADILGSAVADAITSTNGFFLMKQSYVAFSNLRQIIDAEKVFVCGLDRQALSDSIRHSSFGYSLVAYIAHTDKDIQEDVAKHRSHGALAYAYYKESTLQKLAKAHCFSGELIIDGNVSLSSANGYPALMGDPIRAMTNALTPEAKSLFSTLSPRYFSDFVIGTAGRKSAQSLEPLLGSSSEAAANAGIRLAGALNEVISTDGSKALPWSRLFTHSATLDILLEPIPTDAAINGLVNLIRTANSIRSHGDPQLELRRLPSSGSFLDAPGSGGTQSIMHLMGRFKQNAISSAKRTALGLFKELVLTLPPTITSFSTPETIACAHSCDLLWKPALAGLGSTSGVFDDVNEQAMELAFLSDKNHWVLMDLTAFLNDSENSASGSLLSISSDRRSAGLQMPGSFIQIFNSAGKKNSKSIPLDMVDISNCGIKYPAHHKRTSKPGGNGQQYIDPVQKAHFTALQNIWNDHFKGLIKSYPLEMACLFKPIADDFNARVPGCRISSSEGGKLLNKTESFRLIRTCLVRENYSAISHVISQTKNPLARTDSGVSLLDVVLESRLEQFVVAGLKSFSNHPQFNHGTADLAEFIQSSFGKLAERHPNLVPLAISYGAKADVDIFKAWDAVHPGRKSPEAEAAMTAEFMRNIIVNSTATPSETNCSIADSAPAPRRRRMNI